MKSFTYTGTKIVNDTANKNYDFELKRGETFIVDADSRIYFPDNKRIKFAVTKRELNAIIAASRLNETDAKTTKAKGTLARPTKTEKVAATKPTRVAKAKSDTVAKGKDRTVVTGSLQDYYRKLSEVCTLKDLYHAKSTANGVALMLIHRRHDKLQIGAYNKTAKTGWFFNDVMTRVNPEAGKTSAKPTAAKINFKNTFSIEEAMTKKYGEFRLRNVKRTHGVVVGYLYRDDIRAAQFTMDVAGNVKFSWEDFSSTKEFKKLANKSERGDTQCLLGNMTCDYDVIKRMKGIVNKNYLVYITKDAVKKTGEYAMPTAFGYVRGNDASYVDFIKQKLGTNLAAILSTEVKTFIC